MSGHRKNQTVPEIESIKFRREWNLNLSAGTILYNSVSFTLKEYGNGVWKIRLWVPHDSFKQSQLHLLVDDVPKKFSIDLTFEIRNPSSSEHPFSKKYSGPLGLSNGFESFIDTNSLRNMVSPIDDMVHIVCEAELNFVPPPPPVVIEPQFNIPECDLSHDLASLYNDETTADVTLTITNKKLYAHRVILTARSSVFAAMFRNKMKETITKNVDITDLDADTLEQVLRFIYTDQIPNLQDNAIDLLDAADKYDLQKLKAICEKTLYKNVNVESAAEILVMADRHRAPQLKTQAINFIKSHVKEVSNTEGYKNLKEHHPGLIVELFEALVSLSN